VAAIAAALKARGVEPGDRVAGFMPNVTQTVVAMLAATSLGAVWTSCSPDFGFQGVMDRFGQVKPKILFAADGYYYNGKAHDSLEKVRQIAEEIDSLEQVVIVEIIEKAPNIAAINGAELFSDWQREQATTTDIVFEQLPFDHPLYIMYSSGTDGCAQVHCPWGGWHAHSAPEGAQVALRYWTRGHALLLHHLRLDDVELVGVGPRQRCNADFV
jgi:acetoacetyl-CoA synthetase